MLVQLRARVQDTPTPAFAGAPVVRRARIEDMAQVAPLINGFAARGLMLPKTEDQLYRTFREFVLAFDENGSVVGCAGLRVYGPALAELCALAVDERAHGRGVGRALVESIVEQAAELGIRTLFAMTLEDGFFHRMGFRTVQKELFPQKVAADCAVCPKRNACPEITVARLIGPHLEEEDFADA
jgi:amino-acid N-acetyltransferase